MPRVVLFANDNVGLECTLFVISTYSDDIIYIVVTDEESIVYKELKKILFDKKRIILYKDFDNYKLFSIDYIFLLWWPYLIRDNIINLAKKGVVNTHPSLLPYNRGKNYNFWNLVEDVPFGVSLHFVDKGIDSGDIIYQSSIDKSWEDTGKTLYLKAQYKMISLFKESYRKIVTDCFIRKKQNLKIGSYHNSSEFYKASEIILDDTYTARNLLNLLRAKTFPPYEGCFFYDNNNKYEIEIKIKKGKTMNPIEEFNQTKKEAINKMGESEVLKDATTTWFNEANKAGYSYSFSWLGRPIIQYPQDMIAMQEIIWDIKPDLIIETGIAHGGSLIFSASMLTLLEACGEIENGQVLGIDIDIREHNKKAIEEHPLSKKITMFEGSSIDSEMINRVHEFAKQGKKILVCLDSNHTHEHVLAELRAYASLTSIGSYCAVFDTIIEDMPDDSFPDRPWGVGDNPKTAVWEYLKENDDFVIDKDIENKILITVAPDGYLKRIK